MVGVNVPPSTGQLVVTDAAALTGQVGSQFVLAVRVSDGVLHANASVTIMVTDINDSPSCTDASFAVA